ncbi:MAG TPA: MarR family transcriptional regulator [Herpetosiphonaceae bacterium]
MSTGTIDTTDSAQQLAHLLKDFLATVMRHSASDTMRIMRRAELSMPQLVTLWFLRRSGTATISDIREHLNLSLAATSHLVDRLVVSGFVSRSEASTDRRHKQVILTQEGLALLGEVEQARVAEVAQRLADMPPAQVSTTIDMLADVLIFLHHSDPQHTPGEERAGA